MIQGGPLGPERRRDCDDSPQLAALLELAALGRLPRTGWLQAGQRSAESIAAHSHGVATLVLALAGEVEPPLDVDRAVALAVVHDAPEALLGDLPKTAGELLPPGAKAAAEAEAGARLLGVFAPAAHARLVEYASGASREARFVKVCDRLQLGVELVALARSGARGLRRFEGVLAGLACGEFAAAERLRVELLGAARGAGAFE